MKLTICNSHEFKLSKNRATLRHPISKRNYHICECQQCGDEYLSRNPISSFCSNECSIQSQRVDINFIRASFDAEGYTLLSDSYINAITNLDFKCPNGHSGQAKWNSWQQGHRCCECNYKKYTIDDARVSFEAEGYTLLSSTYKNQNEPLNFICSNGHNHKITFHAWLAGQRCAYCYGNNKKTVDEVKGYIEECEHILLVDEYNGSFHKLLIKCPEGHEYSVRFNNFQQGQRCPVCAGNIKHEYEYVKEYIESYGYTLLSKEYNDVNKKLLTICPEGHEWETLFHSFKNNGNRCNTCAIEYRRSLLVYSYDKVKDMVEQDGYKLISDEYVNSRTKITVECDKGHTYDVELASFNRGRRCPICDHQKTVSKAEIELTEFIKSHVDDVIVSDRVQIAPLELDIFLPKYNIAIEYNGLYWHSEQQGKGKNYHLNKTLKCKEKGIQLLHIFEDEWLNNKDVVKSVILSKLGIFERRYYARKCNIMLTDSTTKNEFLDKYHLQGSDNSSHSVCLYVGMEILSIMTFGMRTISGKNGVNFEMLRFCNKPGVQIIGGASKLLKFFIKHYNPPYIKTFADLRYSDGSFYEKVGFKLKHISGPNYWYIIDGKRSHRVAYQKHKLKDKLAIYDPLKTEYENVLANGIDRIYDCGNYVYEYWRNDVITQDNS